MTVVALKLPDVGEGVTEAELVEWHVKPGDPVKEDDLLAAVMTDKATVEIPSLYDGTVVWVGGEIGDVIAVGSDLVRIDVAGESVSAGQQADQAVEESAGEPAPDPAPGETQSIEAVEPEPPAAPIPEKPAVSRPSGAPTGGQGARTLASPAVRARAREKGIDLHEVPGSGPAGRVTHEDLDALLSSSAAGPSATRNPNLSTEEVKVIGLRREIAERMARANSRIPHITVVEEVDVTSLEDLREKLNSSRGDKPKLTVLPFIIAALNTAVRPHPEVNARFDDEAGIVTRYGGVHAGIATMTKRGLMVPVLRHSESMSLWQSAAEIGRLSDAARNGKASREELSGSTITITSLGPLGAIVTTPIINYPEVAIVGVNRMAVRPHWDGSQFVPRKMMNLSCSFDHRIIDGWNAASFVAALKELLETPALIFITSE